MRVWGQKCLLLPMKRAEIHSNSCSSIPPSPTNTHHQQRKSQMTPHHQEQSTMTKILHILFKTCNNRNQSQVSHTTTLKQTSSIPQEIRETIKSLTQPCSRKIPRSRPTTGAPIHSPIGILPLTVLPNPHF